MYYTKLQVDEINWVVLVRDGIARVYGLNKIQDGEIVEFASDVKGMALNLENEKLRIIIFCSDTAIKYKTLSNTLDLLWIFMRKRLC
jgi:F-type H+-transporting ATPase subunit alpha